MGEDLMHQFSAEIQLAKLAPLADELHQLANEIRYEYSADSSSSKALSRLAARCLAVWQTRDRFLGPGAVPEQAEAGQRLRTDFLDLGIIGADLHVRTASGQSEQARQEALHMLAEAEQLFGASPVLYRERRLHAEA